MKKVVIASVGALIFAGALPALAVRPHELATASPAMQEQGGKWSTDAALREAMEGIRGPVAELRGKDRFTIAEYRNVANVLDTRVAAIVAKCKLAPEADASLHAVISELNVAAAEMRGRWPEPARGLHRAKQALDAYQRAFEHAGFMPVA